MSWCETTDIGEVKILGDPKPIRIGRVMPDIRIIMTGNAFRYHRIDVVAENSDLLPQRSRNILVQFDLHADVESDGTGISSSAVLAAKAITARIASSVRVGNSATIS